MAEATGFSLSIATVAAIVWAMVRPDHRRAVARAVWLVGIAAAATALWFDGSAERSLTVTYAHPAYVGNAVELKAFPIEQVVAPGYLWGLCALGFCAVWATAVRFARRFHPFWAPLLLVWSAEVLVLCLQKTAAPAGLVTPLGFDRTIFPASIAAAVLLSQACRRLFLTLCWLTLFVTMSRLPLAGFGTLATREHWGTSLDVHSITLFANPFVQQPIEVAAGSTAQLGWLLWAPNLLVLPSLYLLSTGGIAVAVTMFVRHPKTQA